MNEGNGSAHPVTAKQYTPRLIFWEVTKGCNLRCIHCRATATELMSPADLPTDKALDIISQIADFGNPILVLSGGEPLYRHDIFQLAEYATSRGLRTALATNGTLVTFTVQNPLTCTLPAGLVAPQAVNDPVVGLTPGDVVLFQGTQGVGAAANTFYAVGEVTNVGGGAGTYTVNFSANDPLQMNQPGAANDLSQYVGNTVLGNRIFVISYYMQVRPDPIGATGIPELMRQVSGHTAVPVAENVIYTQYSYDTYNSAGLLLSNQRDGGESLGISLNLIRKINIDHLAIRSQLSGARSSLYATSGYQGYDVQTSISARNLSYTNRY